jgi:alpha-L-arabinofuranosidase
VVNLCSYAPLFAHVDAWQWTPDLIWFDNLKSFGTANYYVQKLFSNNKGTQVLSMLLDGKPLTGQDGLYASAALDQKTNEVILKLVNASGRRMGPTLTLNSKWKFNSKAILTVLSSDNPESFNSLDQPVLIAPVEREMIVTGKSIHTDLAPNSLSLIRIKQTK